MLNLGKILSRCGVARPSKGMAVVLVFSLVANLAGILEFAGIRATREYPNTVVVHDTVAVKVVKYKVVHDTVGFVDGTRSITIDHYIDSAKAVPDELAEEWFSIGIPKLNKTSYGVRLTNWGRHFKGVTDYSLGCSGNLIRDLEGYWGYVWCSGEWVATFREPLPVDAHSIERANDDEEDFI